MNKRNKLIYWISTVWLCLGILSSAIVQLLHVREEVDFFSQLGYPPYLLTILGAWKIPGVIVILMPRMRLLKEWAYAGFFFCMSGAAFSHMSVGNGPKDVLAPLFLVGLTIVSWYFRPRDRRLVATNAEQQSPDTTHIAHGKMKHVISSSDNNNYYELKSKG